MKSPNKLAVALLLVVLAVNPVIAADDSFIFDEATRTAAGVVSEAPTAFNTAIAHVQSAAGALRGRMAETFGPYVARAHTYVEGTRAYQWALDHPREAAAVVATPIVIGGVLYFALRNRNQVPQAEEQAPQVEEQVPQAEEADAELDFAIALSLEEGKSDEQFARELADEEYARFVEAELQPVARANTADDEALARRLQAQFDAETTAAQGNSSAEEAEQVAALEALLRQVEQLWDDEAMAQALQEEMDRDARGELYPAWHEFGPVETY